MIRTNISSMEVNGYSRFEQSYLINELTQGMKRALQLRAQMGPEYSTETKEMLLAQIVSSYNKALFILGCVVPAEQPLQIVPAPSTVMPSSPNSIIKSPTTDDPNMRSNSHQDGKGYPLKRKSASTWTKQVKLNPENGLDGPPDDGYSWRKYGQKDILGAKYPKSYYRCTYRNVQDCWATRQVQRSDEDPTVFDITYRGKHTCNMVRRSKSAPTSPEKQELKQEVLPTMECHQNSTMALSFQTAPSPNNADMHNIDGLPSTAFGCLKSGSPAFSSSTLNDNFYGSFSTSLISPSTTGSNYFSMSSSELDASANVQHQQHNLGADIADMILAATSTANSPTIEPDFSLSTWSFDPNFPSNDPRFFS